ncbi:MAG: helicase-associated domain-containing protein [Planctomycetes bacterium]|nr:helicase-associated domain-containing protein [Planctomycetota bacterium]
MKKRHSWHFHPHPGPDPESTLTLREILSKLGDGSLLTLSNGRLAPKAVPRTRAELVDELSEVLVHGEVFKRTWWSLRVELRDLFWRLLEPLYRGGGIVEIKDLLEKPAVADLVELESAGLLFTFPFAQRAETVEFPYEYFFMPDMPGTGPQSLCQGLRHYSDAGARVLATELGLRTALPRAATLALLHRKLIQNAARLTHNLAPAAASLLEHVASRGGVVAARALSDRLASQRPDWALRLPLAADDLVGARFSPNSPAQLLARRALLAPCGEPGWSAFPQVAIPEELRDAACGPLLEKLRRDLASSRRRLAAALPDAHPDARPGQFAAELRRLALVTHVDRVHAGKGGRLGRAARKRLVHVLHMEEAVLDGLLEFAARKGGDAEPLGGAGLEVWLALPASQQTQELAEDFYGPAGWLSDLRRHLVEIVESAGERWIALDALGAHLGKDPAAHGAYEACHAGEAGPPEDHWIRERATADLRALHRLGFAERAGGATHEAYRLATATKWALLGKRPPAAAARAPRSAPPPETGFAVLPTLEILASPAGGATLLTALARIARLERADAAFVYKIDRKSLAAGLNAGMSAADIREFLEEHSRNPLPETVKFLLDELAGGAAQVTWDAKAMLLRATDPMILLKLRRVKWLRPWIVEGGPEGALRVAPEADGDGLAARLSKEGFVMGRR